MHFNKTSAAAVLFLCALTACKEEEVSEADALDAARAEWDARIAALADEDLRPRVTDLADQVLRVMLSDLMGEQQSRAIEYIPDPFLWMTDYPSVEDMVANYHAGLIAFTDDRSFRGTVDVNEAFDYPFDVSFAWESVSLADGTLVPVSGEFSPTPPAVQVTGFGRSLDVIPSAAGFGPDTPLPAGAVGTVTVAVPDVMHRLRLTAADIGNAQRFDDFTVTLTQLDQNMISLDVSRTDGAQISFERSPLIVAATDTTGRFLDDSSQTTGTSGAFGGALGEFMEALLDDIEAGAVTADDLDAVVQGRVGDIRAELSGTYSKSVVFTGPVAAVELLLAPDAEMRALPLDLIVIETGTRDADGAQRVLDIPVAATGYDHGLAFLTAPDRQIDLAPDALQDAIVQRPSIFWNGQAQVHFDYPQTVVSTLFVDAFDRYDFDAGEATFLDADGGPVATQPAFEFQVNRLEYGEQGVPVDAARVTGSFAVNLMSEVQIDTHDATDLPEGIEVRGNQVTFAAPLKHVFAVDAEGRFLRRLHRIVQQDTTGTYETVDYYYGDPAAVVVAVTGPIEQVTYAFDSPLAVAQAE